MTSHFQLPTANVVSVVLGLEEAQLRGGHASERAAWQRPIRMQVMCKVQDDVGGGLRQRGQGFAQAPGGRDDHRRQELQQRNSFHHYKK